MEDDYNRPARFVDEYEEVPGEAHPLTHEQWKYSEPDGGNTFIYLPNRSYSSKE